MWYIEYTADRKNNICEVKNKAALPLTCLEQESLVLHNTMGKLTHFPQSNYPPSILDLWFTKGDLTSMVRAWSCDECPATPGSTPPASRHWQSETEIRAKTFIPCHRLATVRTNLEILTIAADAWSSDAGTLAVAMSFGTQIQRAIKASVPLSRPSNHCKSW